MNLLVLPPLYAEGTWLLGYPYVTLYCCNSDLSQLALSAASPIYRGYLADIDARWTVISQSVDDRTKEERGEKVSVLG